MPIWQKMITENRSRYPHGEKCSRRFGCVRSWRDSQWAGECDEEEALNLVTQPAGSNRLRQGCPAPTKPSVQPLPDAAGDKAPDHRTDSSVGTAVLNPVATGTAGGHHDRVRASAGRRATARCTWDASPDQDGRLALRSHLDGSHHCGRRQRCIRNQNDIDRTVPSAPARLKVPPHRLSGLDGIRDSDGAKTFDPHAVLRLSPMHEPCHRHGGHESDYRPFRA